MHAFLQNEIFGCGSPLYSNGIDFPLFTGEQELIPIDGPEVDYCDPLCRCRKCCPFDEKWDEALDDDLETVKQRIRDGTFYKTSPTAGSDPFADLKSFSGMKSGFLNKKKQKATDQRRPAKPDIKPGSNDGSQSELRQIRRGFLLTKEGGSKNGAAVNPSSSATRQNIADGGIRRGFLLRGKTSDPSKNDDTALNSTGLSIQPCPGEVLLGSDFPTSLIPSDADEPRKSTSKARSYVKPAYTLVPDPALQIERPPVQFQEPEVIIPIKCSCCQSQIEPKKEVYYEVECVDSCKLFIHKQCLHSGMSSQSIKKKKELKNARCFTDGCSALLHIVYEWNMENSRELYIRCTEKQQPKELVPSKKYRMKEKAFRTAEKIQEKVTTSDSHSLEEEEHSSIPELQMDPMCCDQPVEAVTQDDHVPDSSARVTLAPDLNAVPLLRPKEEAVEKYTVSTEPSKQHTKRNRAKKNRGVSISLDLPLLGINENGKQRKGKAHGRQDDRSDSIHIRSPSVHERCRLLTAGTTSSEGDPRRGDSLVDGLEDDVIATSIDHTQEYFPPLTSDEEHIVQPLVQIVEPFRRDLVANTTHFPQPISKLEEIIETVVGKVIDPQRKLLIKVFQSESLLRTFIRKLEIFTVSRMRGQIYYAKNRFAKRLEQEANVSNVTVDCQGSQAVRGSQISNTSPIRYGKSSKETPKPFRHGDAYQPKANRDPFSPAYSHAWSPAGPIGKTRSVVLEERDCQICLERIGGGRKILQCPNKNCGEPYHLECVRKWLLSYAICPQCRSSWPDPISFPDMDRTNFK